MKCSTHSYTTGWGEGKYSTRKRKRRDQAAMVIEKRVSDEPEKRIE